MNRKFKCIKSYESGEWLTKGKIYTEDNGKFRYDNGWISCTWDYNSSHFGKENPMSNYLEEIFDKGEDKKMREFKVGDKVKVVKKSINWNSAGLMDKWLGEIMTIIEVEDNAVHMEEDKGERCGYGWSWSFECLELVEPNSNDSKSIHISFDNTTTHAVLKDGKDVIKRAKVGLYHEDEYKFETGVIEVIKKLLDIKEDKEEEVKPFVKAKVGDVIRIVKYEKGHYPEVKLGDIHKVTEVYNKFINTNKDNSFEDYGQEYEIIEPNTSITSFSTSEILDELKRRLEK